MQSYNELQHWGVKGQKWGVRRWQNEDGTLTEEGKKHYMTAARKGQLDYKKLSNADLDMINNRFAKEQQYQRNVQSYKDSKFSTQLKKAVVSRITGNGGGGGGGKGKKGEKSKGIGSLLAKPIKKAFEDAFKDDDNKNKNKNSNNEPTETPEDKWYKKSRKLKAFAVGYDAKGAKFDADVKRGQEAFRNSVNNWREFDNSYSRTSEDYLRNKHGNRTSGSRSSGGRGLPSGGVTLNSDEYSIHADQDGYTHFAISRGSSSDELAHYGIKGQRWGVRRFENPDGTLTEEGRRRYMHSTDVRKGRKMSVVGRLKFGKEVTRKTEADEDKRAKIISEMDKNPGSVTEIDYRDSEQVTKRVMDAQAPFMDAARDDNIWKKYELGQDTAWRYAEQEKFKDMIDHISSSTKKTHDSAVEASRKATTSRESSAKPGKLWEEMSRQTVKYWDEFNTTALDYIDKHFKGEEKELAKGILYWRFIDW